MNLSIDHLPASARALVEVIGLPATLRLIEHYGGQVFQVPKGKRRRGNAVLADLAERIGDVAAKKLSATFGGEYKAIPLCYRAVLAVRDAELQARYDALLEAGLSSRAICNKLAKEFGCTHSTVQRASKRAAATADGAHAGAGLRQIDLFAQETASAA